MYRYIYIVKTTLFKFIINYYKKKDSIQILLTIIKNDSIQKKLLVYKVSLAT